MNKIKLMTSGKSYIELECLFQPTIRVEYERGSYPLTENSQYLTPVYNTRREMSCDCIYTGFVDVLLQIKGSFKYAGITWYLSEVELKVPIDENESVDSKHEISVRFIGGLR